MLENDKKKFILNAAFGFAISDSFRRNHIYCKKITDKQKKDFKIAIKQYLRDNLNTFIEQITVEEYINIVSAFSNHFSDRFSNILTGERLRIGTAQKLIGMFLKYLWIFGYTCKKPFLCPFDNIILQQHLRLNGKWTELDDVNQYRSIIQAALRDANGLSLAQWELQTYNRIAYNQ